MNQYNANKRIRTHNTQILTKTQIALQAIKKYQARNNTLVSQKTKHLLSSPLTIFRQIDDHYTKLHFHKELKLDKIMRVQILPYNQEYFCIDTELLIFPVRIFLKNVRGEGTLFVGYDHQYPGVERMEATDSGGKTGRTKGYQTQKRLFDCKFYFNKDILCVLKNQKKKHVRKIYISVVAKKQLVMFNMKFDYIGYQGILSQEASNRTKRAYTEGNLLGSPGFQLPSPTKRNAATYYEQKQANFSQLKRSNTQGPLSPLRQKISKSIDKLQSSTIYQDSPEKNFIKQNLINVHSHRRDNSRQIIQQKKQKALQLKQRIKANKEQIEQYKQKQSQIKDVASKLKKSIEQYQKIYKQQRIKQRKLLHSVAPLVYLSIFMQKSNKSYNLQTQSATKAFAVRSLIKKFSKGLRRKYLNSILQIGNFKIRNQMSCLHFFQLGAKIVQPTVVKKAAQLIFLAFNDLEPALVLNHSLNKGTQYRQSVRTIQRRWLVKYRARLTMLQNFANRHVQNMLKDFPHLKLGQNTFKNGNHCYKVCYQYMVDQSAKFKHIYHAYKKRVQQIDEFVQKNYEIQQYNKGKPESKKKQYLDIPQKPFKPQQRIFRNLDILKSMLRGWFQIQYKKILKRSISNK